MSRRPDFDAVNRAALADLPSLLARWLPGGKREGTEWVVRNPKRDDHSPGSFKINTKSGEWGDFASGDKGGDPVSLYGFLNGLGQGDAARALAAELGVGAKPNGHDRPKAGPKAKANGKPGPVVATYDYVDENGVVLFRVVRFEPKDFRQQRPNGKGGWAWGLGDTRRVLYHLPEVLKADEVVLCEGEKDADRLRSLGFVATTNPGGGGNWDRGYVGPLEGKDVVLVPDNDVTGRRHIVDVCSSRPGTRVLRLEGLDEKGDVSDWLDAGHTAGELRALIAAAPEWEPEAAEATADGRALVRLAEETVNANARECSVLLVDEVFMRGPLPVVPTRVEELPDAPAASDDEAEPGVVVGGVRHAEGSLVFAQPSPERVQFRLDDLALFEKYDGRSREWAKKSCPIALARRIIAAAADLRFRPCAGTVTVPLFVRGEIVAGRGYHAPTALILDSGDAPAVPERPTRRQARRACIVMLRPFRGYLAGLPGEERRRLRAAILAAVLTAVLRPSLPAAPVLLLDANVPGAGKGKMARALSAIASGRYPSIITEGHDAAETEKRLAAGVLGGSPVLLLDNVQRTLASSTLESGLTEGRATIRPFGTLAEVTVPCAALVLVTVNNAPVRADMLRRAMPVRIVVDTETPELRRFEFDPYVEAKRRRPAIVAAALTVARAWWLARDTEKGRAIRRATLGSFELWADLVAGPVEWLAGTNPVALIETRKAEDPRRGDERALVAALRRVFGPAEWKAGEAASRLDAECWAGVVRFKGERPTGREIGGWLRARKDRVFGRLALRWRHDAKANETLWRIAELGPEPDDGRRDMRDIRDVAGRKSILHGECHGGDDETKGDDKSEGGGGGCPATSRRVPAVEPEGSPPWTCHHAWLRRVAADPGALKAWIASAGGVDDGRAVLLPEGMRRDPAHAEALEWLTASIAGRGLEPRWRP